MLFPAANTLPLRAPEQDHGQPQEWRASGVALAIDDEESVRALARRMLERMGFEVLTAAAGRAGVERFRANEAQIRLCWI
jgi:hypothetical protein